MADPLVTRYSTEVLASAREAAAVTRQGIQVAFSEPGANSAATAAVTRFTQEVLAAFPEQVSVTRQGIQVAFSEPGANSDAVAAVTRLSQEVLAQAPPKVSVTRQGIQVAFTQPGFNAAAAALVTRFSYEALGRRFIQMEEFDIPANFKLFLHNWVTSSSLESSWSTDVTASASDLAEDRVGLLERPYRALKCSWLVKGAEDTTRLLVEMRRLVDETSVVPLYMDAVELTQDVTSGSTIYGDFSRGRFFINGPVVMAKLKPTLPGAATEIEDWEIRTIEVKFDERLEFSVPLTMDIVAGRTVAIPLMQTHPQTKLGVELHTNNTLQVSATFDEIYGSTALPPIASNQPDHFQSYNDFPILSTTPQWDGGVSMELRREGSMEAIGRGRVVYQRGDRHRQITALVFEEDREGGWDLIRFFETRRGRLIPFWVIDFDNSFPAVGLSPSFFSVSPVGELSDFQAELDFMGVIFSDGTAAVREVTTVQEVAGVWRITMDSALPAGYTIDDVVLFGRARLCRMEEDALEESWPVTNVCSLKIPVLELLAEQEVTT